MTPQATFLMTTYNGGEFLGPAIASVLAQTEPNFRMLVIDDASSDGSAEVARSFGDPRIEVLALERNIGQTAALNLGLERIETPWVARLDQDDLAAPQRLERQLDYLASRPGTVLVGAFADFIDEQGHVVGHHRAATEPAEVLFELFAKGCPIVHSAVTYRTDVARRLGGYPARYRYAQDLAMWIAMSAHGDVANIGEVLTSIRIHADQTSRAPRISAIQLGEMLEVTEHLPSHLRLSAHRTRLWHARRTRLMLERAFVARRAGDGALATHSAGAGLRGLVRRPSTIPGVGFLAAATVRKRLRRRLARG